MQKLLFSKIFLIVLLMALLMIPLSMIDSLVTERSLWRDSAVRDIASSFAGSQKIAGPLLVVPYTEFIRVPESDPNIGEKSTEPGIKILKRHHYAFIMPEALDISADMRTEERYRGIYTVPTYTGKLTFQGAFRLDRNFGIRSENEIAWDEAFLWLAVDDNRGIQTRPTLQWQGRKAEFTPGAREGIAVRTSQAGGISANVGSLSAEPATYVFSFDLPLAGTERLDFVPVGRDMTVKLHSDWQHPSFSGRFLPAERTVNAQGFTATWKVSHFASNAEELLQQCASGTCDAMLANAFGVNLIQPVDTYQQTDRAIKYAVLFIGLTFTLFFLFETLKRLPVHPIQYGLVGTSLAIFYLLLLSLSEHMAFTLAYAISAGACVLILASYVSAVLHSLMRGMCFASGLSVLYGTLFCLLRSEENALLMGSVLLFVILSGIMQVTRKVDWYAVTSLPHQR